MPPRTEALLRLTSEAIDILRRQRETASEAEDALRALLTELERREEDTANDR
jgi:hypothetical protein